MLQTVVIVGRPNVGKSTIFNRITRSRQALVADKAGVTRDRIYAEVKHTDTPFFLIDTGGLGHTDPTLVDEALGKQVEAAVIEADLIIFVVDAKAGLTATDVEIANFLRKNNKKVLLCANKLDSRDVNQAYSEFAELGFDIQGLSAEHNIGVGELFEEIDARVSKPEEKVNELEEGEEELDLFSEKRLRLAICGKPNVGKSTLVNRILGEERVVVLDMPGTTTDSIYIDFDREGKTYTLIDTAGLRRKSQVNEIIEKFSAIRTLQSIREANVVLMLINAADGLTAQDMFILDFAITSGRALVVAVNKWDLLNIDEKHDLKKVLERKLIFVRFAKIHYISALKGSGVNQLWPSILEAYSSATQKMGTSILTDLLQKAVEHHTPPLVSGRRIKLRYAHSGGANPPRIIVHGKQTDKLPEHYVKYLINYFQQALNLVGTPVKIEFITDENPYKDKRNKLTPRQERKRKRMMAHYKKRK